MAAAADHDVIMDRNAELLSCVDDAPCHFDIGERRCRIARRMIVDEHDGACRKLERPLDHLARIDRGVIDSSLLLHLIGNELVLAIEKQDPELRDRIEFIEARPASID